MFNLGIAFGAKVGLKLRLASVVVQSLQANHSFSEYYKNNPSNKKLSALQYCKIEYACMYLVCKVLRRICSSCKIRQHTIDLIIRNLDKTLYGPFALKH